MGKLRDISLSDKYTQNSGMLFMSGNQALVRLPLIQYQLDRRNGLNTGGFISGYRGSPLGGYDAALWQAKQALEATDVRFQPGLNEELAATAVTGSQQLSLIPDATHDGVFGIWYGKGPGVDRALDALRHGNFSGADQNGGVLVLYGDDHPGKSSTICNHSEPALAAAMIPSFYPANVGEFIEFGLLGWAASRYSGLWIGFKCVNETVEQTATVEVDLDNIHFTLPDRGELPEGGVNYRPIAKDPKLEEVIVADYRIPLLHKFIRANHIDRITHGEPQATGKLAIATAGKAWQETVAALKLLGIDKARAIELGLSVYKLGCIWPIEPQGIQQVAERHSELLVVEEKKAFMQPQIAELIINLANRPRLSGKRSPEGDELLPSSLSLSAQMIARAIALRLVANGCEEPMITSYAEQAVAEAAKSGLAVMRTPYFCSGCPHNTSTKVPAGSVAMGGIGCHAMASAYRPDTLAPLQMGGEGCNWIGIAPFTNTQHVFQNLGDGTYYHSGLMAIRAAVAGKVNITYKILYNDAVAMTGGQPVDGPISVAEITHQVLHEGVKRCVVVSDYPEKYRGNSELAAGVEVLHRDQLDQLQRQLREIPGCTVIVYEQTCAAEKRRRRKRGKLEDPAKRMYINPAVCEGCGDCSAQSTCVSIQPLETALGRKRQIDQSSCNKDYSCNRGFCPSFVTIYDAQPKKPEALEIAGSLFDGLPTPQAPALQGDSYNIMITGIGGTGVITVGAVLGMAAHLQHRACSIYDMTGLSQKNGAVYSHLKIADQNSDIGAQQIATGEADLLLGFDMVASVGGDAFPSLASKTHVVGNSRVSNTVIFQFNPDDKVDNSLLEGKLAERVGEQHLHLVDASTLALKLCGDTIASNMFMVGFACQNGLLPLSVEAIERAIELNGTAVAFNLNAFRLGRVAAHDLDKLLALIEPAQPMAALPQSADELIAHRSAHLTGYQNAQYAQRYQALVERVRAAEQALDPASEQLTATVARYYAKLLSYKDEYEVARLHSDPANLAAMRSQFSGDMRVEYNLAPPLLSKRDPVTGHLKKRSFGPWIVPAFRLLAKLRFLRGTALDIFGKTAERKMERQLIADYEALLAEIVTNLNSDNFAKAVELAALPETIRGYGHVKERHVAATRQRWAALLEVFRHGEPEQVVQFQEAG